MSNYLTKKTLLHPVFFHDKKKFKNHPIIEKLYKDTMQEHIFQGHTSKLSTEAKTTTPITNYLSHHRNKNINTNCSPSCFNWILRKTAFDNCKKFNVHVANPVLKKFYMDDYFDSFGNLDEAINTLFDVAPFLKFGCFNLATFISSSNRITLKSSSLESLSLI